MTTTTGASNAHAAQTRRRFILGSAGLLAAAEVAAQAPSSRKSAPADAKPWRLLVNEAFTGEMNLFILTARYRPLADYVSGQLRTRPQINIEPVVDVRRFVQLANAIPKPELVFGKTVNQLALLVRDGGYQPVVRRSDPYKAAFIAAKDSQVRTLQDTARLKARIMMPDVNAATTAVALAELRRLNVSPVDVVHTRYQEAVAQQVAHGFVQVGVVNPTIARKWAEDGGRVLAETQPVVNWSLLAAPSVPEAEVLQLRSSLLAMNTQAPDILAGLGVKKWAAAERKDFMDLLEYTKE